MTVWLVMAELAYEGEWVESVHATKAGADAEVERLRTLWSHGPRYYVEEETVMP